MLLRVYSQTQDEEIIFVKVLSHSVAVSLQTSSEMQRYFVSSVWIYVPIGIHIRIHIPIDYTIYFEVQSSNSTRSLLL